MAIQKVALLGGQGRLGAWILKALQESQSAYPEDKYPGLHISTLPDDYVSDHASCVQASKGQDALVIAILGGKVAEQMALATACLDAGVQRMFPADYGSLDSDDLVVFDLVPIFGHKRQVRHHLQSLANRSPSFSWTLIVCGHFIDYVLESPRMLRYDLARRRASVIDTGDERWSACTRDRVGATVVKVLSPDFEACTRNAIVFVHSSAVTQNAILDSLKRVDGGSGSRDDMADHKWHVERHDGEQWIKDTHRRTLEAEGDEVAFWHATEELVGVLGIKRANWEAKEKFMDGKFGFEDEDLGDVVRISWGKVLSDATPATS